MLGSRFAFALATQVFVTGLASARDTDPVTAEVLFQEARELLNRGKLDEACPKFLESERLDPATATLLAVATCHEKQGLWATAWAEFTEAAGRARQEGRKDRERLALERVKFLEPRLSTLTLVVAPELVVIEGLRIRRDGLEIGQAVYNRALPIDGGVHEVEVSAPGYIPEALSVTVERERDRVTLTLPSLRPEPAVAAPAAQPPPSPAGTAAPPRQAGPSGTQVVGAGMSVAGIGAATVGAVFLVGALLKKDQSNAYCTGNACDPRGLELRAEAVDRGNVATALGVGGALLGAAGLTLYWIGGLSAEPGQAEGAAISLQAAPDSVAASVEVGF
jgi:hypothetical protein